MTNQNESLRNVKKQTKLTTRANIKVMPPHDPDADIASLVLTIPSWVSSIERTRGVTNLNNVSYTAQTKLLFQLQCLKFTIDSLLTELVKGGKVGG